MATDLVSRDIDVSPSAVVPRDRFRLVAAHVAFAAVFLVGGFSVFFRLGDAKSLGSHEGYALIPAREMLLTGDFIVPRFGEMPRLQKPPLVYWSILGSAQITGRLDIFSARLPAAIAGVGLASLMAAWAWRWYGPVAASGAAAAQLTSVYVLTFARKADVDMLLLLLISLALYLIVGHEPAESRPRSKLRWLGVWIFASVSWMGKFHFGPAMMFAPVIIWLVFERRWRFLAGVVHPIGLLIFTGAVVIWPLLVLQRLPGAWTIWQDETIGRAIGELGRQPITYYLPHLVTWTLPWTIFAVLAWPASWQAGFGHRVVTGSETGRWKQRWQAILEQGDCRERFLWVWLLVVFALISLMANKHPHYILPALPAFSLWTGRRFAQLAEQFRQGKRLLTIPQAAAVSMSLVGGVAGVILFRERIVAEGLNVSDVLIVVTVGAAGLTLAVWLLWAQRMRSAAAVIGLSWLMVYSFGTVRLVPAQDHRLGAYRFAEQVRTHYVSDIEVGIYGIDQDAMLWYLGEPTFRAEEPAQIVVRLNSRELLPLLTIPKHKPDLARLGVLRVVRRLDDSPVLPPLKLGHYRDLELIELRPSSL